MKEYVIQNKVKQFIENYQQIKKLKGSWSMGMIQYSCALSLAMRNQDVNIEKIEKNMEIIKNNTGIFSNFRGYSMYYIATLLSTKDNAESEFKEIMDIFQLLKEKRFWNDAYLPFVAITLYENKDKIDELINKYAKNWSVNRMPKVDLSILRLAICELVFIEEIPSKVSINEAIELAKLYCDDKAPKFINGILGSVVNEFETK